MNKSDTSTLQAAFGSQMKENVSLSGFTSARIGGPADVLITVRTADELSRAARLLWEMDLTFQLIGGGSNVLVSDKGIRGVTLLNRARLVKFELEGDSPQVFAESGASLNDIAQRSANHSFSGLEWAASVPGSLGGAIYGNAGAFGGEMSTNLLSVEILDRQEGLQTWMVDRMEYGYRTSILKRTRSEVIILAATLKLISGEKEIIRKKMAGNSERRHQTQPPGASMGSMFKNPPGDKAGRLLEAAGLKGTRIGTAEISMVHANFFINTDQTLASDMKALLELAQETVYKKFGVKLESEIEIIGDW
jgi:UDP-N-acetylmuramate dehydrogenase